jgi:hypothetical protein
MTSLVGDARPPRLAVAMLNPMLKLLLRTPVGRSIRPLALLDFTGRRSGRRLSVVVGWHSLDGLPVVITPASWRANFTDGHKATVRARARSTELIGSLDTDPEAVARCIAALVDGGTAPRALGLSIPEGHTITADDVRHSGRAIVRFSPATTSPNP